jgi:hypothetical protein
MASREGWESVQHLPEGGIGGGPEARRGVAQPEPAILSRGVEETRHLRKSEGFAQIATRVRVVEEMGRQLMERGMWEDGRRRR